MRKKGKGSVVPIRALIGMTVLTIALAFCCAKMIVSEWIQEENFEFCVYMIVGIVSFSVGLYCAICMPQKKALWGIASAACYAGLLLLSNVLFFGVGYGSIVSVILCILISGCVGSVLGAMKKRKYA